MTRGLGRSTGYRLEIELPCGTFVWQEPAVYDGSMLGAGAVRDLPFENFGVFFGAVIADVEGVYSKSITAG